MKYFTNLTSDLNCPADLRAQALFAYGDYWTSRESTNKLADYAEAIKVFSEIGQSYPTNHLAVLALGRMASCLLQLKQFEAASNTYQQVIVSPLADGLGLRMLTPATFLSAISEGSEPTAADKTTIDNQIKNKLIKVYVFNSQNATPDVQAQVNAAKAAGIPVTTVTETLDPPTATFQDWQVKQLQGIEAALAQASGKS